ncbi:hypothetical protein M8C21_008726 [Ambrosia artemisiifolia]|uniref:FBD domain-containing protein n=1 Tax=Ambrosia artemisiifolia TaxID=4212 RepID=A0AAD5CJA2_AMBAR|nr:hypothetical protein M8C21_008726 [Ambrosia artemisiifolia]
MDRISKLPIGVIETILCLLPIQEAARTSILSKEWRYHWLKIPKLAFDEDAFELSVLDQAVDRLSGWKVMTKRCRLFYAIFQVLLVHEGPIHEFILSMRVDGSYVEIDHILLHLSKKNTLKILKLDFKGIYSVPQRSCYRNMDVPGDSTIADFITCLLNIEYLSVWFDICLSFLPFPKELPTTLIHLKYLCMEGLWLRHKYGVPNLVLLIKSSPNLEKLKLEISVDDLFDESEMGSVTVDDYLDIMLRHLNDLEILHFSDEDNELDFVKLILAKSPVLKKASILLWDQFDKDERLHMSQILLSSPCASPVVKLSVS